jgi:hypothetical protein
MTETLLPRIGVRGEARRRAPAVIAKALAENLPFQSSGSLKGAPVDPRMGISTGQMPPREAARLTAFDRLGSVDYVIWSYATPIAYRITYAVPGHKQPVSRVIIPAVSYSNSTGKQQGVLRQSIDGYTT